LDIWEIALDIEESFKIHITQEEVAACKTVQDLLTLINSKLP
jgi:acyl carrier protein